MVEEKDLDNILIAAAKETHGYVYYDTELTRTRNEDGTWKVHIDVYEKYRRPSKEFAAILEEHGATTKMHSRQ